MDADQEICRICLRNAGLPGLQNVMVNIYNTITLDDLVANLIIECGDIEVACGDGCPEIVCSACLISLEQAYSFKNLIRKSDRILKDRLDVTTGGLLQVEVLHQPPDEDDVKKGLAIKTEIEPIEEWIGEQLEDEEEVAAREEIDGESPSIEDDVLTDEEKVDAIRMILGEPAVLNCCMCGEEFDNHRALLTHAVSDHGIDANAEVAPTNRPAAKFPCMVCKKARFGSQAQLQKHQQANVKKLCAICGGAYTSSQLKQHMLDEHAQGEHTAKRKGQRAAQLPCPICQKWIAVNQMWIHKQTHRTAANFECHICGKTFKLKNYLKNHVVRHYPDLMNVPEKKFDCTVCGKMFGNQFKLKDHFAVHTGEKRYQCEYCDQKFKNTTDRRRHQWLTHTGSPYTCKNCNKPFDRPSLLKIHENNCATLVVEIMMPQ